MQNERSSIVQKGGVEEEGEEEEAVAVAGGIGVTTNTRQAAPQCMRKAMKKTCSKIVHSPKKWGQLFAVYAIEREREEGEKERENREEWANREGVHVMLTGPHLFQ